MKKIAATLLIFHLSMAVFSQALISSHPLQLRNPKHSQQLLNGVNSKNQVFAFASDKDKVTVLKYNHVLFFSDSLSINRPDKAYDFMAGYSFEDNGNPYLYWASEDFKNIQSIYFDFENKINQISTFHPAFKDESVLTTFSENNAFYILALPKKENKLKLYVFKKGIMEEKVLDFSSYAFTTQYGKTQNFNELLNNGLAVLDTKFLNPLFESAGTSKMYLEGNQMILTFDSNTQTQLFKIDLAAFSISQQIIPQQVLVKPAGSSNSYFLQNKLYQVKANAAEIAVASIDLVSGETLKKYYADTRDTISFRNSPLLSQTGSQSGKKIKNSKKFLERLADSDLAITAYKTPDYVMLTVGGVRTVNSTGGIIIGISAGAAMMATGTGGDISSLFEGQSLQSTYFESLFDEKFEHQAVAQKGLAVDFISQFLSENEFELHSVFSHKDYFIVNYYDPKKKELLMRKFEDVAN